MATTHSTHRGSAEPTTASTGRHPRAGGGDERMTRDDAHRREREADEREAATRPETD